MNPVLSRTSSLASVTSDDATTPPVPGNEVKRTRKRFTQAQIVKLEQLFHETSHPTREQRENLANECDLYVPFVVQNFGFRYREFLANYALSFPSGWGVNLYTGNCDRLPSGSRTSGRRNGNPR